MPRLSPAAPPFAAGRVTRTPKRKLLSLYAQWACENDRPENLRVSAATDPHSPGRYRINGIVSNLAEFQQAFACRAGQPMVRETRCKIW